MPGLSLSWTLGLGIPALFVQSLAVAFARALRTYSRSRLEEVCKARGKPERADAIARADDWTERGAEALALVSSLVLAAIVGAHMASGPGDRRTELTGVLILLVAVLDQVVAGAVGRVWAETLLASLWPLAAPIRVLAWPLTGVTVGAEWLAQRFAGLADAPRPASVEVEIPPDEDHPRPTTPTSPTRPARCSNGSSSSPGLTSPRSCGRGPRSSELPADIAPKDAARAFRESGYSRIPLFGESRDDIIGVLYAKDLFPALVEADDPDSVVTRKLVRPPYFVPESKNANDLLDEFRAERLQIALVLDEYGAVVGLVTFEDLIEELVGPISDEHDKPQPADPVVSLGDSHTRLMRRSRLKS